MATFEEEGAPVGHRYRRFGVLGRGAMGTVYAGEDVDGTQFAIKVLRSDLASDPLVLARFVQERTLLLQVTGPNVVRVVDFVVEGETLAIIMERVEGGSLRELLVEQRVLGERDTAIILSGVLAALASAHEQGIVHRDIKPENVLIRHNDEGLDALVTDFGISGILGGSMHSRLTSLIGTPNYMAPELANDLPVTVTCDVYAAGIMAYECLTGLTPFAAANPLATLRRHVEERPLPLNLSNARLESLIMQLLSKEPGDRPAAALASIKLRDLASELGASARSSGIGGDDSPVLDGGEAAATVVKGLRRSDSERNEFHATPPVGGLRAYESEVLPPERQTTRNLVVLLLDNSGSMTEAGFSPTRTKLAELNDALGSFLSSSMHQVPQLEMNGEIAIGTFAYNRLDWVALGEGSVSPSSPFHYARYVRDFPEILPTQGTTPMDVAVLEGLSAIEARKRSLAAAGFVHESRPVMFLLTDGESSNDMTAAIARLREAEAAKKVLFFALGVGEVDDKAMRDVAPTSYYSLKDQPLEACLRFVSGSLGVLSGVNDSAEMMYDTVRRANSRSNMSADDFLRGFSPS